jgi:hypothetical protein
VNAGADSGDWPTSPISEADVLDILTAYPAATDEVVRSMLS